MDYIAPDGTHTYLTKTPVDRVAACMARVMRERAHVDAAVRDLVDEVMKLLDAAKGDHR